MNDKINLVSVVIITFNRKDALLLTLQKLKGQDYNNLEIIIVDNGSNTKLTSADLQEFQGLKLINLEQNEGIKAFNYGIDLVTGEYILILDDDSYPELGTIKKGIDYLVKDEICAAVAFNIYNSKFNFYETAALNRGYVHLFVGCGALFKSEIIRMESFYDNLFFVYYNEIDLAIRLYNKGYKIFYLEECKVTHFSAGVSDKKGLINPFTSEFRFYHVTCGYLIFLSKHFSSKWVIIYSLKWNINRIIVALRSKYILTYLKSIYRFIKLIPKILQVRKVVKKEVQILYKNGNMPLVDRDFFPEFDKKNLIRFLRN